MATRGEGQNGNGGRVRRIALRAGLPAALAAAAALALLVAMPDTFLGGSAPRGDASGPAVTDHPDAERFASSVVADADETWGALFDSRGESWTPPAWVFHEGVVNSACGVGRGPFYCDADRRLYIDVTFLDALDRKVDGDARFAQSYVVAHLVAHHVQAVTGAADRVRAMTDNLGPDEARALTNRLELQADCLAGVWARRARQRDGAAERTDIEASLAAVAELGAELRAEEADGDVLDSLTHASAEQRAQWFRRGAQDGDIAVCDTFSNDTSS